MVSSTNGSLETDAPSLNRSGSGRRKARTDHQIDVPARGMAPLAELIGQGLAGMGLLVGFQLLQALVHEIEGVVDQLGGLFRGHGG
jgi:hypothetical protein